MTAQGEPVKVWRSSAETETSGVEPGTVLAADKQGIVVKTATGALRLLVLQPAGKKPLNAAEFLNGRSDWFTLGSRLPGLGDRHGR
jgi:methionyl-tRNA formyltransferase